MEKQLLIKILHGAIECEVAQTHIVIQGQAGLEHLK